MDSSGGKTVKSELFDRYSIFGIGVYRRHYAKWLFPQEKVTFQCSQKVYVYSENALNPRFRLNPGALWDI
jgi:hypothetical protein